MAPKTILITGSSTGIGRATALHFQAQGWNVIATMRSPDKETALSSLDNVLVTRLDVTDADSITAAVTQGIDRFGTIDALVNNAGYGAFGPLEAFTLDAVRRQFDTNVIGLLAVTKAILPHFRANQAGVLVNIGSVGGQITFPLGTLYHGTKFAVEGISEGLQFELAPVGIRVKIIEPGMIKTDFDGRSFDFANDETMAEYQPTIQKFQAAWSGLEGAPAQIVADAVWAAVTDGTSKLRYPVGADAEGWIAQRQAEGDEAFIAGIKQLVGL